MFILRKRAAYRLYCHRRGLKWKLAVLINENTASASEILAGAVQESG
ncbi:hypothetical protein CS542_02965 [Pedobacter sp. IW39]|nr:hypothetical protein CS542_02965 [Pedobacter sp. IW39]